MKRITLILISIFVLVIGVGCAAASDVNSDSVAGTSIVKADFDSGFLNAPVFPDHFSVRPDLQNTRPDLQYNQHPDLQYNKRPDLQSQNTIGDSGLKVPVIGAPALGSALGGGGNQNFY